jgi:Trypsin
VNFDNHKLLVALELSLSARRLARIALSLLVTSACLPALYSAPAGAFPGGSPLTSQPLVPYIIGGQESSISQFPWQVFVLLEGEGTAASCGGSIIDASHILTAAHCVDHEGTTTPYPAGDLLVIAGASEVVVGVGVSPSTRQVREVKSLRADPYYTVLPDIKDDVAVLELSSPLELSPSLNTQAIALVPAGATPAPGTPLSVSGYGKEEGAEGPEHQPNGKLYSTALTAIGSDACRASVGVNSAVLLCAQSGSSSTCQGDSGGPLTEGNPAVQVGIVDFGPKECPVGQPDGFSNLAAPEVRAFVEGSEAPPVAARPVSPPALKAVGAAPVDFSPLTCEPGAWSGGPSFTYTFQEDNPSAQVLQSGPGNVYTAPAAVVGAPIVCIVQASNPGGVSTLRSGTTPPIAADAAPPVSSIVGRKCRLQTCTLQIAASDPNAVALTLEAAASYQALAKCPVKKHKRRNRRAKRPVCHRTATVKMSIAAVSAGVYQASATGLPYERVQFVVAVSNAAGLRQLNQELTAVTLHKPKPKKKKHGHR